MKKRIAIVLSVCILLFIAGGTYIVATIASATAKLDHLIMLHQVEILREHLLLQIRKVQSNLMLSNSDFASSDETVATNVRAMQMISATCKDCHHRPAVQKRLDQLINDVADYKMAQQLFMASQEPSKRSELQSAAYRKTEKLESMVNGMIHIANNKLADNTQASLADIARSKVILYVLVAITPLIAGGLGLFFIRELAKPVGVLLNATRRLKSGDLNYRIEGLSKEFAEVAISFNQMSEALKQQMLQLQESEKRYRMLFESAGDAIFILEAEGENRGRIVAANRAAAVMHGYSVEELLKMSIQDLDAPAEAKEVSRRIQQILAGKWITAEIDHIRRDGTIFPVEISAGLLELEGRKYVLAFDREITERKQMENMLLQSKQEWEDTFDTITDMISIHDRDFNIIRANKAAQKILGLPLLDHTHAKCYEYYHGKNAPPQNCLSCECFKTGEPTAFEVFEPHLDRLFEVRAMPRFDADGQLTAVIHVLRDITERKRIEETLQRAEQMKLVGEWATALAHEIKNPLAGIKVSVEVLSEELELEEDKQVVQRAVEEIKRIENLLKSLLNFAKPPKPQLIQTDLNELLDKTAAFSLKQPTVPQNTGGILHIVKEFAPDLPRILADPMQLQQIFLNLLLNSIEAMPDGGTLSLKTTHDPVARNARIEIADTGKGMEPAVQEKIFEPFFTTKKKGSGLGLAVTKRLIEQHSGDIHLTSESGKGTVFVITFPIEIDREEMAE
jgi:PAS domain S-box-containing protein